jgi:hypothetical protein
MVLEADRAIVSGWSAILTIIRFCPDAHPFPSLGGVPLDSSTGRWPTLQCWPLTLG